MFTVTHVTFGSYKFIYLNIRILKIVAGGHGGTRQ